MCDGAALCIEVDRTRIERRLETGYLDERAADLDDALARLRAARRRSGAALSIGLLGNAAEVLPELVRRGVAVDVVTDQTSAHDPLNGYLPAGPDGRAGRRAARERTRIDYLQPRRRERARRTSAAIRELGRRGAEAFDYGNALRGVAAVARRRGRVRVPRVRAGLHPAAVLRGQGPVPLGRAVRRPGGHRAHRRGDPRALRRPGAHRALDRAWRRERVQFQGLPARICWLGLRRAPRRRAALQRDGRLGRAVARRS